MNMKVNIAGVELKNPIMTGSGTFNSGMEFEEFIDLNQIGAVVCKGVANKPWLGNPSPRIAETYGGMLNAVGLQNSGVEHFIANDLEFLKRYDTKVVVNLAGRTIEEYCEVARRLQDEAVDLLELNISCPNVKEGGVAFGVDPQMAAKVTKAVKAVSKQPLLVKLSPNVTDIVSIAKAVEDSGADGLTMINTLIGMRVDVHKRKPVLANKVGGFSGPAIKPVGVRMVYQVAKEVKIPIVGLGGIMTGDDAIEYMMVGASAVAVGTANLINPRATMEVLEGMKAYMDQYDVKDINDIVGIIE